MKTSAAAAVVFTLAALGGCASAAPPARSGLEATAVDIPTIEIDPALVGELLPLTASLIRACPENPPGNERRVVDVLAARLGDAGIHVVIAPFDATGRSGGDGKRANLKAVLPGRDRTLAPFVLFAHSDVVPADPAEWSSPPYEAIVHGERLIGRGAVDMLSMVSLETLTLVALKRAEVPLDRDVILVVTGDGEVEGRGMQAALREWPELTRATAALTEGGLLVDSDLRPGEDLAGIAAAEKGAFQFVLEATGPAGRGSTPLHDPAPDRLVRAVARILDREAPFRITAPTARQLADVGAAHGGLEGLLSSSPALAAAFAQPLLDVTPSARALYRDTCALTTLDAGIKRNVIPGRATATFDCRLLPGTAPAAFRDSLLATMADPRVTLRVLEAHAATSSDPDHLVVKTLRARIHQELPGAATAAILSPNGTDCRFLREARPHGGVPCYGFIPVRVTREEQAAVHGKDEAVRIPELEKGLSRLVDVTAFLARSPAAP